MGIKAFFIDQITEQGIGKVMKETFEYLGDRNPIHISFDIDAYDYSIVTGTGTPSLKILLIKQVDVG